MYVCMWVGTKINANCYVCKIPVDPQTVPLDYVYTQFSLGTQTLPKQLDLIPFPLSQSHKALLRFLGHPSSLPSS
jgi:hypothetical protein